MSKVGQPRKDFPDCPTCETDVFVSGAYVDAWKYECNFCHEKFGRKEGVDLTNPSNGLPNNPIEPATDEELTTIYKNHTHFGVAKNRNRSDGKMHLLRHTGTTYCKRKRWDTEDSNLRKVEKSIYPKGYLEVCKECMKEWRDE